MSSVKTIDYRKTTKTADKKREPVKRSSMEGNWIVQITNLDPQRGLLVRQIALLSITKADGAYQVNLLGQSEGLRGMRVGKTKITPKTASIVLQNANSVLDFEVTLDETVARGNGAVGEPEYLPVEFVATNETRMQFGPPQSHPLMQEFGAEVKRVADGDMKAFRSFLKKHSKDPVSYFGVTRVLDPIRQMLTGNVKQPTSADFRGYLRDLDQFLPVWGRRAHAFRRYTLAVTLLEAARLAPDVALKIMRKSEEFELAKYFGSRRIEDLTKLGVIESNCKTALSAKDESQRRKAVAVLEDYVSRRFQRREVIATYRLAQAYRKDGRDADAVKLYARLFATPAMELELADELRVRGEKIPQLRTELEQLWAKKKRDKSRLEAFLTSTYRSTERALQADVVARKPVRVSRRTIVCELFTNCDAPQAVAPDLALTSVKRSYPASDLIVLRYHLDLRRRGTAAKPDPLTCNDSKARAFTRAMVPSLFVNGRRAQNPRRGFRLWMAREYQAVIRYLIQEDQRKPADYRIKLTGGTRGDKLSFRADVSGPKTLPPDLRVVFVLAEDHIDYAGENRIRRHDMVVRALPSGTEGEPFQKSHTTVSKTVDLKKLSEQIRDYLQSYEEQLDIKLPFKPFHFHNLHLVGLIQNGRTGEVLQAASIRVGRPDAERRP
ncbi:MAG: hypothetical protein ACE5KM_14995 [Planctomycetaceae bacterium]